MTSVAQRIAVAESIGWTHCRPWKPDVLAVGRPKNCTGLEGQLFGIPFFDRDIDAIHPVVRSRPQAEQWFIFAKLAEIVDAEKPAAFGTAAEYTKAYLMANNRWDDSK